MILPRRRATMPRATAWPTRNTPREVGPDHLVPDGRIHLEERAAPLDAGIVDEDVDRADLGLDAGDSRADLRSPAVTSNRAPSMPQALAAQGVDRACDALLRRGR